MHDESELTRTEPQPFRATPPSRFDATSALAALAAGVLVVTADWCVVYGNAAAAGWLQMSTRQLVGADLRAVLPMLAAEGRDGGALATRRDGRPRTFRVELPRGVEALSLEVRVCRDGAGQLVFELAPVAGESGAVRPGAPVDRFARGSASEENAALRLLARQMAELSDSSALLHVLCQAAWAQCGASGAAVAITTQTEGTFAVGVGALAAAVGAHFPLAGSLTAEAIAARAPLSDGDALHASRPLAASMRRLHLGPVLVAPLVAHDQALGAIAVVRPEGTPAFAAGDVERLQVIADHASLAIWKAQLLEQAQAADAAKGRFLATMSHELRTPLTALTGYGELLADQVIGPLSDSQMDVLERMRSVTHHLATMIEEILAFTSLEAGHEGVRPTEFLAADLVAAVATMVEPLARQKGLRLATSIPDEPLRVTSDIDKLRQVLVNLAGNAVKFTEHGEVRIGAAREGETVRFFVSDTGIGIAEEDLPRLFRPFTQLDTGLTRRHGGTGLGLYISHRLAAILGGHVAVKSAPGEGSTFALVIPLHRPSRRLSTEAERGVRATTGG